VLLVFLVQESYAIDNQYGAIPRVATV
jgi:hypothetical protein